MSVPVSRPNRRVCVWPHFFTVANIPGPMEWTKFKDLIRSVIPSNQPGWTDTGPQGYPPTGSSYACFSVKSDEDAQCAFKGLGDYQLHGRSLLIHHYDVSMADSNPKLLHCTCATYFGTEGHCERKSFALEQLYIKAPQLFLPAPIIPQLNLSPPPMYEVIPMGPPSPPFYNYLPTTTVVQDPIQANMAQPIIHDSGIAPRNYIHTSFDYPVQAAPLQIDSGPFSYPKLEFAHRMHPMAGMVRSKAFGIHITNLNPSTNRPELEKLLKKVGNPTTYDLHRDHSTGRFRGTAEAYFAVEGEAKNAINHLNNYRHKGKEIRVRATKDSTALGNASPPLVVNGSTGYQC